MKRGEERWLTKRERREKREREERRKAEGGQRRDHRVEGREYSHYELTGLTLLESRGHDWYFKTV